MGQQLRPTSGGLLRRTPEIAAYGYVLDRADGDTQALWLEAIEHLRGREIYPADRQSFIFNPIEILGIAVGLAFPAIPTEHREWFSTTIQRGIAQGQFRTPLSRQAAQVALEVVGPDAPREQESRVLDLRSLTTPDLILSAAIACSSEIAF
jgi:hypothetical protein